MSPGIFGITVTFFYAVVGLVIAYEIAKLILQMFILFSESLNTVSPMYG